MQLPVISPRFSAEEQYAPPASYDLLPFRFDRFDEDRYIAVNLGRARVYS